MNFFQAITSGFSNYVTFSGRAARSEYWYWVLFVVLTSIVMRILDGVIFQVPFDDMHALSPLKTLFSLAVLLPGLAVLARRLHDTNHSGWWILIAFIPIIGIIILLVWVCKKGTAGDNRFGSEPLAG